MKMLPITVTALILLVTGCATAPSVNKVVPPGNNNEFTATQAIAKVNGVLGTTFPSEPGTVKETIVAGGPSPGRTIPATLQTEVQKKGSNTYLVTFSEQWNGKDFRLSGEGSPVAKEKHFWTFKVTPSGSTLIADSGNFPPQEAR